jgi:hypothetical protein
VQTRRAALRAGRRKSLQNNTVYSNTGCQLLKWFVSAQNVWDLRSGPEKRREIFDPASGDSLFTHLAALAFFREIG